MQDLMEQIELLTEWVVSCGKTRGDQDAPPKSLPSVQSYSKKSQILMKTTKSWKKLLYKESSPSGETRRVPQEIAVSGFVCPWSRAAKTLPL